MTELILYTAEVCPYAQRTRILLGEKSIAHEAIEIDYDDKPDWFLLITPAGRVPVIRHDDFVLWESATINEYLDATFPGPALRPSDERGRAVMRNEIRHFDNVFLPLLYKLLFAQESAEQDASRAQIYDALGFLESRLALMHDAAGGGPFWMGPELNLADLAMYPFFERFAVFDHYRSLKLPDTCQRLRDWLEAMEDRTAVSATMHDLDYFIPRYASYASGTAQGLSAQAFRAGAAN